MKAKINKGVRPFSGRTFDVVERHTYANGREVVVLDVGSHGSFGQRDKRVYGIDEVTLLPDKSDERNGQ